MTARQVPAMDAPARQFSSAEMEIFFCAGGLQEPAGSWSHLPELSQVVVMAMTNDYLGTKHALVAMALAFKKFIEYSSHHDAYLIGRLNEDEWAEIMERYGTTEYPDASALSGWIEITLRDSGIRAYADEIAVMFDVPEEQAEQALNRLASRGILRSPDG